MRQKFTLMLPTFLILSISFSAASQMAPAPPAPPSPVVTKLYDCILDYTDSNYSRPEDAFEVGTAVLSACRTQADAVVLDSIQSQAAVGGLRRTNDSEANNDNTKAVVYFEAQRNATMRIIRLRSEARKLKGGL